MEYAPYTRLIRRSILSETRANHRPGRAPRKLPYGPTVIKVTYGVSLPQVYGFTDNLRRNLRRLKFSSFCFAV